MQRRHWPFGGRPQAGRWPLPLTTTIVPGVRPVEPERTEEDEAEHQLMILVGVAMVAITAASAAVSYLLI